MSKLTKDQTKRHEQCLRLLEKESLSTDDKFFVLENYHEGATNMNAKNGAFFTPQQLARDIALGCAGSPTVDLCAGIGALMFPVVNGLKWNKEEIDITCVEFNREYFEVGRKIIPEAKWHLADVTDFDFWCNLLGPNPNEWQKFEYAYSNPPFGKIKALEDTMPLQYKGAEFDLKVAEICAMVAEHSTLILPQMSTPFRYSGGNPGNDGYYAKPGRSRKYDRFTKQTGIEFTFNIGIDTDQYKAQWKGVSPTCEIVHIEDPYQVNYKTPVKPTAKPQGQIKLF